MDETKFRIDSHKDGLISLTCLMCAETIREGMFCGLLSSFTFAAGDHWWLEHGCGK